MRLTREQYRRLTDALVKALRKKPVVERVVRFGLDEDLDAIVGGDNLTDIVFNLVMWVESQERLEDLVVEARRENPGNLLLKAVSKEVFSTTLEVPQEGLEAIVSGSGFSDIEPWLERMWQCSLAVCCIEISGFARGTGFLLNSDLVMTSYHVMEDVIDNPALWDSVVLRFHYKVGSDGRRLSAGVECYLAGSGWLLAYSPIRKLDYALLCIDTSNLGHNENVPWVWNMPQEHTFRVGEPLCIIQHPQGNPQKIALGAVTRIDTNSNRVHYTINTLEGSSGSPCISSDGTIVAQHQRENDPVSNKGIPFSAILADLRMKGHWA